MRRFHDRQRLVDVTERLQCREKVVLNYGEQVDRWSGVDFATRVGLFKGVSIQGGVSAGRLTTDNCEIVQQLPEMLRASPALREPTNAQSWMPTSFCHQRSPYRVQVKGHGAYEIPKAGIQVGAVFQSLPGAPVLALYSPTRDETSLGRLPSGSKLTVHMVPPGTMYGERLYQVDLQVGRIFRQNGARIAINAYVFNLLNANTVLRQDNAFVFPPDGGPATWQKPTEILQARLFKLGVQIGF